MGGLESAESRKAVEEAARIVELESEFTGELRLWFEFEEGEELEPDHWLIWRG